MDRALTKHEATKSVRITPERHKALRQAAIDINADTITEAADFVIEAGLEAIRSRAEASGRFLTASR